MAVRIKAVLFYRRKRNMRWARANRFSPQPKGPVYDHFMVIVDASGKRHRARVNKETFHTFHPRAKR